MKNFTKQDVIKIAKEVDKALKTNDKIKFNFDKYWSSNFEKEAGVYAIFDRDKLVYIGQTANLKERMKEVKRTYNHSFRRKLGRELHPELTKNPKGKFSDKIENELDAYFLKNISFTFKVIHFGRLEIESYLIHSNDELLNSKGKRDKIK